MMNEKLRAHIDELFKDAPKTKQTVEIKEEILQNTVDRYNDLLAEGKSEEAAYNISVAGIGDVSHLIDSIIAPTAVSGYTKAEIEKINSRRSVMLAVAVMLYICAVIPAIICDELNLGDWLGATLMFVIAAIATGILIYRSGIKPVYNKTQDTVVEDFKEWNSRNKKDKGVIRSIEGALWAFILVIYFVVSFGTGAWYITWVIFLIGVAITNIAKAIYDLTR